MFSVGDVLRAEDAGIVCYSHGAKIAVTWDGGSETELDAEWVFDKVTNVPPPPRSTSPSMCLSMCLSTCIRRQQQKVEDNCPRILALDAMYKHTYTSREHA